MIYHGQAHTLMVQIELGRSPDKVRAIVRLLVLPALDTQTPLLSLRACSEDYIHTQPTGANEGEPIYVHDFEIN